MVMVMMVARKGNRCSFGNGVRKTSCRNLAMLSMTLALWMCLICALSMSRCWCAKDSMILWRVAYWTRFIKLKGITARHGWISTVAALMKIRNKSAAAVAEQATQATCIICARKRPRTRKRRTCRLTRKVVVVWCKNVAHASKCHPNQAMHSSSNMGAASHGAFTLDPDTLGPIKCMLLWTTKPKMVGHNRCVITASCNLLVRHFGRTHHGWRCLMC
mmetsp:Transcript_802/g.1558  ORF Transcript_802/g.1558 Transcript_802/m.1558 type:complete len:217 (+) Transcript_802:125-775(+)